jgi:ATP-dependent RNA helicase SUPV3L1/SUV3
LFFISPYALFYFFGVGDFRLVESTGDEFILKQYDRLSTLEVADQSLLGDYKKVRPGDCIVAFSKADIFSIRKAIEKNTSYKCAIIYGQLPPETRSTQARLFNEENTGFDILVASDAIGMGKINDLNIFQVLIPKKQGLI